MTIPAWFWTWARWYLGRSEFKGHARDPKLRPKTAPRLIPAWAWAELLRRFVTPLKTQPKPVELPPLESLGRNVLFTAWNPEAVLAASPRPRSSKWKVALSADPSYEAQARAAAPKLRAAGYLVAVWGNQSQTGADRIHSFAKSIGADYTIFQAETADEYDTATAAGAKLVVGNPHAWTAAQRDDAAARANRGEVGHMMEVYSNETDVWPDTADAINVPIVSEVVAVGFGKTPYQLADYGAHTPPGVWATMGVYLAETMSARSWALLP